MKPSPGTNEGVTERETEQETQQPTWETVAYYEHWELAADYKLEPLEIKSNEFRVIWNFSADADDIKRTLRRYMDVFDSITEDTALIRIKLENLTHHPEKNETFYFTCYGIELSLSGWNPWDSNVVFGTIFHPQNITGNVFQGEATFRGKGKIMVYVETLWLVYPHLKFGGTWRWELAIQERK